MRKTVRVILWGTAGLGVAVAALVIYIGTAKIPFYEVEFPELYVEMTPERVEEGARIASVMCLQCHASPDGKLGGSHMDDAMMFGDVYSANITRHEQFGIGTYSDGELAYLLRSGVRRDGRLLPPWMPKFPNMSDEDLYSIIAFLKSDHELVAPSEMVHPESKPSFLAKMILRTGARKPLPFPGEAVLAPLPSDSIAYGRYLAVGKFDCYACHSASFSRLDPMHPEESPGYFGGGNVLYNKEMDEIYSANLTMDPETGLGNWTEEEFVTALRFGRKPDGSAFRFPMVPAPLLTEGEAASIWKYLQTIPVIHNPE